MVQLRKSRKSFRKTRGRKTRQRKNEKRKSRKTRSTRKTGGDGEEKIADKIKELASKIGEVIGNDLDETRKKGKIVEIQGIFNWLIKWKLVRCGKDATCQRKKMIYYYIAIHLFVCFREFILKGRQSEVLAKIYENLIAKFEKHTIPKASVQEVSKWLIVGEMVFITDIVKTLYDSILEENERAVDYGGYSEGSYKYYGHVIFHVITGKIEEEVKEENINVSEGNSIFVKWIEQIKKLKINANEEMGTEGGYLSLIHI